MSAYFIIFLFSSFCFLPCILRFDLFPKPISYSFTWTFSSVVDEFCPAQYSFVDKCTETEITQQNTKGMQSPMDAGMGSMAGYNPMNPASSLRSPHHHSNAMLLPGHPSHAAAAMMMAHPSMTGHPTSPYDSGLGHGMDIHANWTSFCLWIIIIMSIIIDLSSFSIIIVSSLQVYELCITLTLWP